MFVQHILLPGVLLPSLAALLLLLLGRTLRRGDAGAGLAVAGAFLTAFVGITNWPSWPPIDSTQRLFYLVILAALASLAASLLRQGRAPWLVRIALMGLLLTLILKSKIQHAWTKPQTALYLLPMLLLGLLLVEAWARALDSKTRADSGKGATEDRAGRLLPAMVRLAILGGTAFALGLSGSARLGQLAGALACGATVVEALALLRHWRPWRQSDGLVVAVPLYGLLLIGYFYAELSHWAMGFLLLASLALWIPHDSKLRSLAPLLPLAVALSFVIYALVNKEEDPYDYYSQLTPEAIQTLQASTSP